ncbi:unnamed protein product [Diabrotica balteata]|uniref:Cytokine receptor-like factor 3 n=1 Tax=Diabrotica balteata TaxID=107213 RepID=A0A9N9SXZ4_DIABA|nr:unnamed protein product [Diabrotica balteata]
MNNTEVHDTVQAANIYLSRLKYLNSELDHAMKQILSTFEETEANVSKTFCNFKEVFIEALNKREKFLLDKAKKTKIEALAPLRECRSMILDKIESTVKLINTGSAIISSEFKNIEIFSKNASLLGTLPEVPELKEVPYISFSYEPSLEIEIVDKLSELGDIYKIPPVQFYFSNQRQTGPIFYVESTRITRKLDSDTVTEITPREKKIIPLLKQLVIKHKGNGKRNKVRKIADSLETPVPSKNTNTKKRKESLSSSDASETEVPYAETDDSSWHEPVEEELEQLEAAENHKLQQGKFILVNSRLTTSYRYLCMIEDIDWDENEIKIAELTEKPGAVLVEWKVVVDNEEKVTDIEEFRLQKALGNVYEDKHLVVNFHDTYKGLDYQFLQKDLKANEQYSFRVCCKFEGTTEWSPWSLPQVGSTSLKHFSWQFSQDYELTNEFKVAKPKRDDMDMLYSEGAQFSAGHAIDFMVLTQLLA